MEFYSGLGFGTGILPYLEKWQHDQTVAALATAVIAWRETNRPHSLKVKISQKQTRWNVKGSLLILHGI